MTTNQKNKVLEAVEELGGANRIHEELNAFSEQVEHLDSNRKHLLKEFPNKWVAMFESEIIPVSDTLEEVLGEIDKKGIPRSDAVVEFLNTDPQALIL